MISELVKIFLSFFVKKVKKKIIMSFFFLDYLNISKIIKDLLKFLEMKKFQIIYCLKILIKKIILYMKIKSYRMKKIKFNFSLSN